MLAGVDEPSQTPEAVVHGVTLHSGDLLVSRGAATSALIARGNDFPGNFSHVALVHVGAVTHAVSVIEAQIECGVLVSPIATYLRDTELRIMTLRLRAELPALVDDPLLPHRAAERGEPLRFNLWQLPLGGLPKAYSVLKNWCGRVGPIPEGMSVTTALRVQKLMANHAAAKARLLAGAEEFKAEHGYPPPYWMLVSTARGATKNPASVASPR